MPADAVDFSYYQYRTDTNEPRSMRIDKTWGDDADAGFGAAVASDAVLVDSPSSRPRKIILQDLTSGRITTRVVATTTATAWTTPGYTATVKFRGLATGVTCTKINQVGEHIRRLRTITSKAEPA